MAPDGSVDLAVSISPHQLQRYRGLDADYELSLDWEHTALLRGETSLQRRIDSAGVAPDRIRSVHLPPGIRTRGDDIGMAVTEANRGTILEFVETQLSAVPEAFLVAHPPKDFEYGPFLDLLETLCDLTGRPIAIENTPVQSDWYTPAEMAFFAYAGAETAALDDLYLTVDSAHLPHRTTPGRPDDAEFDSVCDRVASEARFAGLGVEGEYRAFVEETIAETGQLLPDRDQLPTTRWTRFLNALSLAGRRVRNVHLNDPHDDGLPTVSSGNCPVLKTALELIEHYNIQITLERGRADIDEIRNTVAAIRAQVDI